MMDRFWQQRGLRVGFSGSLAQQDGKITPKYRSEVSNQSQKHADHRGKQPQCESRWCSCICFEPVMAEHSKVAEVIEVIEGTVAFINQPKA